MKDALVYVQRLFQSSKNSQSSEENSRTSKKILSVSSSGANLQELCRQFSLAEIKFATKEFDKELVIGNGIFGRVYKGFIDNGTVAVAVKRLAMSSHKRINFFKNEVQFLCQVRHPNLISFIGFCTEGNEMFLVYEYMHNLSLDRHVHGLLEGGLRDPLSWEQRLKICIALARALHYLHAGVKYGVIHAHLKSSKILLDENWNAKISDFKLSKTGPLSMSKKSLASLDSRIIGTLGYMAPEYAMYAEISEKCDVYSFGVVLLEVLCARRPHDLIKEEDEDIGLIRHACKCIENGSINAMRIDAYLEGRIAPECLRKFVEIAYDCVRVEERDRPSMGEVEMTLELALELQEKAQLQSQHSALSSTFPDDSFNS